MMDAKLVHEMGTDAAKWTKELMTVIAQKFRWSVEDPNMDPVFEMESLFITWFANAIEKGRDEGPNKAKAEDLDEDGFSEGSGVTLADRAIQSLQQAVTALEELPYGLRSYVLKGMLGPIPLNNPQHMRQEAEDILLRMDAAAQATREA